jgi:hypothetical protein
MLAAYAQSGSAFSSSVFNDGTPAPGLHAGSEPVFAVSLEIRRLKCSLHYPTLIKKTLRRRGQK